LQYHILLNLVEDLKQKLIAERKKNQTLQLQYNSIKKSLIIAVSHPAEPGGGPEAEAHSGTEEEFDPGGQRPRGTLPGTETFSFLLNRIRNRPDQCFGSGLDPDPGYRGQRPTKKEKKS
jgi:hypothetical protein